MEERKKLYPLKFMPIFKEKVWGGDAIKTKLGLNYGNLPNCGEAWMLSGMEDDDSIVVNGFLEGNSLSDLIEVYMGDLVGEKIHAKFGLQFPILVKWIDAREKLSVQVHPNDVMAKKYGSLGKSEMWFVQEAKENASLICGFKDIVNREKVLKAISEHKEESVLKRCKPSKGDLFYVPAGTIHSIEEGLLLAEIQQCSDITFRIYDWNRQLDGKNPRDLHIEEALDAIDFSKESDAGLVSYGKRENVSNSMLNTDFFTINYLNLTQGIEKDFSEIDSFVVYLCTKGNAVLKADDKLVEIGLGELILIPASNSILNIFPDTTGCVLVETYMAQ